LRLRAWAGLPSGWRLRGLPARAGGLRLSGAGSELTWARRLRLCRKRCQRNGDDR
jgi:hypothetical protein